MGAPVRLQRYLSAAGVAARRKAEELIVAGRVTVNNEVVTVLGTKIDPDRDHVQVDGEAVVALDHFYVLLNKPKGCITAVVADRGDAALGLVEQHVEVVERDDSFTVHLHVVAVGVDLGAEHGHDLVVHRHATRHDQLLRLAACSNPSSGEVPLQADRRSHGHSASGSGTWDVPVSVSLRASPTSAAAATAAASTSADAASTSPNAASTSADAASMSPVVLSLSLSPVTTSTSSSAGSVSPNTASISSVAASILFVVALCLRHRPRCRRSCSRYRCRLSRPRHHLAQRRSRRTRPRYRPSRPRYRPSRPRHRPSRPRYRDRSTCRSPVFYTHLTLP